MEWLLRIFAMMHAPNKPVLNRRCALREGLQASRLFWVSQGQQVQTTTVHKPCEIRRLVVDKKHQPFSKRRPLNPSSLPDLILHGCLDWTIIAISSFRSGYPAPM